MSEVLYLSLISCLEVACLYFWIYFNVDLVVTK